MKIFRDILPLIFIPMLAACSLFDPNFLKPTVQVSNVRLEEVTLFETTMLFKVRVSNDNPFPVTLDGSSHEFYLNGTYIGKGSSRETFTVAKFDSSVQEVPVHISNLALVGRIQSLLDNPKLSYKIESRLYVDRGFGSRSVTSTNEGEFDVDSLDRTINRSRV